MPADDLTAQHGPVCPTMCLNMHMHSCLRTDDAAATRDHAAVLTVACCKDNCWLAAEQQPDGAAWLLLSLLLLLLLLLLLPTAISEDNVSTLDSFIKNMSSVLTAAGLLAVSHAPPPKSVCMADVLVACVVVGLQGSYQLVYLV